MKWYGIYKYKNLKNIKDKELQQLQDKEPVAFEKLCTKVLNIQSRG